MVSAHRRRGEEDTEAEFPVVPYGQGLVPAADTAEESGAQKHGLRGEHGDEYLVGGRGRGAKVAGDEAGGAWRVLEVAFVVLGVGRADALHLCGEADDVEGVV